MSFDSSGYTGDYREEAPPPLTVHNSIDGNVGETETDGENEEMNITYTDASTMVDTPSPTAGGVASTTVQQRKSVVGSPSRLSGDGEECLKSGTCPGKSITIGEPEKDQLKSVGRHLLQIGRQLLQEMNFVESLVTRFGHLGFESFGFPNNQNQEGTCAKYNAQEQQPNAELNTEAVKAQLVEAISAQAQRLSWIEQATEDFKSATQAAQFGSAFGSPSHSQNGVVPNASSPSPAACSNTANANTRINDIANQELRKRLTIVEAKMEKMACQIEGLEKQIIDAYNNLNSSVTKLSEDASSLREAVQTDNCQTEQGNQEVTERMKNVEAQIVKLAQVVWELKCETRAQMHFGKEY